MSLPVKNAIFRSYYTLLMMSFSVSFSDGGSRSAATGRDIAVMTPFFQIGSVFFGTLPGEDDWWRSLGCSVVLA